jgi:hypothetical protein
LNNAPGGFVKKLLSIFLLLLGFAWLIANDETVLNNDWLSSNAALLMNTTRTGQIDYFGDQDFWTATLLQGDHVTFSTLDLTTLDTVLELYNEMGVIVASNDDWNGLTQSYIDYDVLQDGDYYLLIHE